MTVPDQDWNTVPARERATIDHTHDAEVAKTQAELQLASAALVDALHVVVPHAVRRASAPAVAPGDDWADAMRAHDRSKADALAQIDAATTEWQRASVGWRAQRVDLLTSQLAVLRCVREVERARAIDHHLLGQDTYDTAEFRGQLAHVQERWFAAQTHADAAHADLERATAKLVTAKETYAELVRRGPAAPTSPDSAMRLTEWSAEAIHDRGRRLQLSVRWHRESYLTRPARIAHR